MKKLQLRLLVPGIFAATLALALGVAAQTPPPAASSPQLAPTSARHPRMTMDCKAMMARQQEMQEKLQAMDTSLDKLVAEMNAAQESKDARAMETSMVAVINELVAQRKASRSMMMGMQPVMMTHMMQHMHGHGTQGAMECPMMKTRIPPPEPKAEEMKHEM